MGSGNLKKYYSHLNTAVSILEQYRGEIPFHHYLKSFFSAEKKYGSKDRRNISHLCYCYFRTGKMLQSFSIRDQIIYGLFLCSDSPSPTLETIGLELNQAFGSFDLKAPESRLKYLQQNLQDLDMMAIFPLHDELSDGIDTKAFLLSLLIQPELFLRIRPGKEKKTISILEENGINCKKWSDQTLSVPNRTPVETLFRLNRDLEIQDYSSQRTAGYLPRFEKLPQNLQVWDCCAASGGKSIMVYDSIPGIELTVSDKRFSILQNLKLRLKEAEIPVQNLFTAEIEKEPPPPGNFDLIIADLPCTGSGTWGRSPENLRYFQPAEISRYAVLQKKILSNIIPVAKTGGYILYITCSVFKKENEELMDFAIREFRQLKLVRSGLITGYSERADSMYAALIQVG